MASNNIKVAIKARPILKKEKDNKLVSQWKVVNNSIKQVDSQADPFCFDHVFDQDASNQDIFDTVLKPIVDAAVKGFNGTIFAYGQTSSGKTYTMLGDEYNPGVMVLTAKEIFKEIELAVDRQFLLRVGYIEIYNEKVYDLLNKGNVDLKIHETPNGDITVNCEEIIVTSEESLMHCLLVGSKHRRIGETNMNERSSRSHSIFRIIIESGSIDKLSDEGSVQISNLNLVDLAGSERADQTGATGTRLKEGAHINKSLLYLSRVINSLSENEALKYINYRDSKLTRILQASLGGNALTAIVCNINPTAVEETNSTLNFAMRAKCIKNKPQVNEVLSDTASIKRLQREINRLESELQSTNNKMKVIQLERQIYEERLKIVHSHSGSKDTNLRRRTWSACVNSKSDEQLPDLKPFDELPLKIMTPLITFRGEALSPLEEFKCSEDGFNETSVHKLNEFPKTPEVFRPRDHISVESPADNNIRCRQVEKELQELMDFTNLEKKFNVEHEVVSSLNRKLQEAQDKIVKYEEEKFEILSSKMDEWNEKEMALKQQYLNLQNEMAKKDKILEDLRNREAVYKTKLDQSNEKIKTLQVELSDKSGREYELELHQQRAKNRERELLEALEEKEKEINNLNEKFKFVNDIQSLQSVRRSTSTKINQAELEHICEKCKEYFIISFNRHNTENLRLREEKCCIQKENDELSSQLMEAIQECDGLRSLNEKLQTELATLTEQNIASISREEHKLKSRKDNILRFYQESVEYFPELLDGSADVNNCLLIWDLCDFWEKTSRKCTQKLRQLSEDVTNYELKETERQKNIATLHDDLLISKKENNDLLEKICKLEDKNSNLDHLVQTKQQEIIILTDEMQSQLDLLLKDNSELQENAKDLEHKLNLNNDVIAELRNEISATKKEWLNKLNNLEPLKTKNDILCTELSESTCTISQQLNEIKSLTTQIENLEEQVSKEKALSLIKMVPDGVSTVLVNENTFMEEGIGNVLQMDEFIINLDALKLVIEDNTANLCKEGPLEEQYAKLAIKDVINHSGSILYICGINQEISNNKEDKHVVLLKGNNKHNVKFEIKYILKAEVSDIIKSEESSSSNDTNMENVSISLKDGTLIKNMHNKNEIMRDYSKVLEVILTKLDSHVFTTCSVLNAKIQWLDEKLSRLEKIQRTTQNNTCKEKSQINHDVLLKEQRNLIQQTKNVESRISQNMLDLNSVIETFSAKLNSVENLRDALEKCFLKLRHESKSLVEEKNTTENANNNLNSEICSLQKFISDTKVQFQYLEIENNELKKNLIQKEADISDLRKENHKLANQVLNLESAGLVKKSSGKEKLKEAFNKDLLNQSQLNSHVTEDSQDQLNHFESENCELRTLDIKNEHISDLRKDINKLENQIVDLEPPISLEKMSGEEDYKNPIMEDLNQSHQFKIMGTNELNKHVKKMNDLLSCISLYIKGQFELHEHNISKTDDDLSNDVQGIAENNLSLVVLNEKLEYLLKEIQRLDAIKKKEIEQLKEAINFLNSEKIPLIAEISESQKRNEELQQNLLDLSNTKKLLENKIHELNLAQKNLENIINDGLKSRKANENHNEELQQKLLDLNNTKTLLENKVKQYEKTLAEMSSEQNAINDELKSTRESNESLTEEVKSLKDLKNELERQRDIYCEENSKLEKELEKSNDLIKHTEEDCLTLKLSISSLRDKVLQLEKERNTLLIERSKYETNIEELKKEIINLKRENSLLMSEVDNFKKKCFTFMKTQEENTKLFHSIEELKQEIKDLKSENSVVTSKFDNLNKEHISFLEKHKEKTNLCRSLEENIIALQKELDKCKSKKNYLEMQTKALELKNKQLSVNSVRLDERVKDLCEENQKIRKDCSEECERLKEVINITSDANIKNCKKLQETKSVLDLCEKQISEERAMQVKLLNRVDELSKKLENITSEYNACLLHVKQNSTSSAADINDSENNSLLTQLKEMEKMYLLKSKELQNQIKVIETAHSELLQSIPKIQANTVKHCCSGSGNKGESNNPAAFGSDLKRLNHSNDQRHQKIIDTLLGENKQLRIKNEKLEAELTSARTLSQKDRKSRRQSTHDEKRQSLWDSTCEVGTMTQPTDQLCNCEEFDIKVKELKRQLKIKECQMNTLLLEMKTNPLKEENQSLKKLLSEEESEKKKLRIDISKLKQEVLDQANRQKECDLCASKANKLKLNKYIQTENTQSDHDEELVKLQKKYEDLKAVYRMRKDTIRDLEKRINIEKENEANNKQNPHEKCVPFSHLQSLQEMLETLKEENRLLKKKYDQTKVICIARGEEIECLEAKLKKTRL